MGGYTKKDAAKDTEVPVKEVSEAYHKARDDAEKDPDVNFKRNEKNEGPLFKKKK